MRRLAPLASAFLWFSLAASAPAAVPTNGLPLTGPLSAWRGVLVQYLDALRQGRYAAAYALLDRSERAYFKTPANFASVFTADRFALDRYQIVGLVSPGSGGGLISVSEHVRFLNPAHGETLSATVAALYGIQAEDGALRVRDTVRAWKAFNPPGASTEGQQIQAVVRKVSFYPGRIEVVLSFINRGDHFTTLLPYGRSLLRSESGVPYRPIETKIAALTDRRLRLGVRLAGDAEYTGALNFAVPDGSAPPKALELTVAPLLQDGADNPFALTFAAIAVP